MFSVGVKLRSITGSKDDTRDISTTTLLQRVKLQVKLPGGIAIGGLMNSVIDRCYRFWHLSQRNSKPTPVPGTQRTRVLAARGKLQVSTAVFSSVQKYRPHM
jgi:hypothetical protein